MSTQRPAPVTADGISLERAHLVGVGGAGMSGLARLLLTAGKTAELVVYALRHGLVGPL